jgi:malate dehydrogenase (oxaloacetate-decarboxylating)
MTELDKESVAMHAELHGKLEVHSKVALTNRKDLSLAYTPGVAQVCQEIAADPRKVHELTLKHNTVAVVSDGSAILGIGNLGPEAAIPVMEGKAVLFKEFAGVDAFPICLATQDVDEIVRAVRLIAPVFGGINLEDISAPRCFEVEARLQDLGIPVFHDDQHGTAIVVLAAMLNALKVAGKTLDQCTIVFNGSGASAIACARLILSYGDLGRAPKPGDLILCDSKGIVHRERTDLNAHKRELAERTNHGGRRGGLADALRDADIFIGLSQGNLVSEAMVRSMRAHPIILAMANPIPEIMPDAAREAGAAVVGTGRSDFPNQINNVLAFPGVFRGALDAHARVVNEPMKIAAAEALASYVIEPTPERILPDPLDKQVALRIGRAVANAARDSGVCR